MDAEGGGGIRAPSWGNRTLKIPSSLDFGDSVSRTDASDSPGLGWQVYSTCTSCCYDYRSKPSVALLPRAECDVIPQRNTSQLIRAALSGPALRMSNQTSWWLVPCLGSHTLMEAVPRLDKDPLNTISVSTHFAFLHLFWSNIILSTMHHTPGSFSPVAGSGRQPSCQGKVTPWGGTLQTAFSASSRRWALCLRERKAVLLHKLDFHLPWPPDPHHSVWRKDILCYNLLFCSL